LRPFALLIYKHYLLLKKEDMRAKNNKRNKQTKNEKKNEGFQIDMKGI
jgi:hypothetical protein